MRKQIDAKAFRLVAKTANLKRIIEIPETKRGFRNQTVGGKSTFLMAIDAFTTQFKDKEELLEYVRKHNLAKLPNDNNLYLTIEYTGSGEYTQDLYPVYNDKTSLTDFINNNYIKEHFPHDDPYVEAFKEDFITRWTTGLSQAEYRIFMTGYKNKFFGKDLIRTCAKMQRDRTMQTIKAEDITIGPLSRYHNLRGWILSADKIDDILFEITREKIWSWQERREYEREMEIEKPKSTINIDIVKVPETKTKVSEEQLPKQTTLFDDSLFFDIDETPKTR